MFNWSKKKGNQKRGRTNRESTEENEFGIKIDKGQDDKQLEAELKRLAGVDNFPEDDILNEDEEDEELELLRLMGEGGKGKRPPKKTSTPNEQLGDISDLTADTDLGDEDVEIDENDPELLGELMELINPEEAEIEDEVESEPEDEDKPIPATTATDILSVLKERLKMYKAAEAKAKENKETSRARRFARGIKTLEDLLKKAKAGKAVAETDIPPVIAMNLKPAPPPQQEIPTETNGNENETAEDPEEGLQHNQEPEESNAQQDEEPVDVMTTLTERLKLYQTAEAKAKESGETMRAKRFARGIKTIEGLIKQAIAGDPVAAADIPPVVALNLKPAPPPPLPAGQDSLDSNVEQVEHEMSNINLSSPGEDWESKQSEESERNIMDVLSERLKMYKTAEAKAEEIGETTRARRFRRGIKTLQDMIRQATAGKPIPPDDIPPIIALNLKPAPPVVLQEEDPSQPAIERENLVQSTPIAFNPVDDVDLDEELAEEEKPRTVLEGLEQRLRFYSRCHEKAREEGNEAVANQNEKIVRVYANAIKTFRNGGYVDVLKLPNPKGCPPIPIPFYVP